MLKNERVYSIDIARYIAAILVVALHTSPFAEFHPMFSYLTAQILPRLAVPFFCRIRVLFYSKATTLSVDNRPLSALNIKAVLYLEHIVFSARISGNRYNCSMFPAGQIFSARQCLSSVVHSGSDICFSFDLEFA